MKTEIDPNGDPTERYRQMDEMMSVSRAVATIKILAESLPDPRQIAEAYRCRSAPLHNENCELWKRQMWQACHEVFGWMEDLRPAGGFKPMKEEG